MYVQVVTYGLAGITEGEYLDVANSVAARFSGMPGLLAKLWLGNTEEGRYGAVYLWEDRDAMERFLRSDLFEAFNPEFADVAVEDFDVLENLTAATQPVLEIVEPKRRPPARTPSQATPAKAAAGRPSSSGARRVPVTSKAATKATKKVSKAAATRVKKAPGAAKGAVAPTKKAATPAAKKTARKTGSKAVKTARKAR